jgi:hypothetical protein
MKITIAMLLSVTLLGVSCSSNHKKEPSRAELTEALKEQKAETLVTNMFSSIDKREWKEFEKNFASRSVVFFDEPLLVKPKEITSMVKPVMEYFDSTKHEVTDFKLTEKDERILGSAKVKGNYWKNSGITSDIATLENKFDYEFVQEGDKLRIMRMSLVSQKIDEGKDLIKKSMQKDKSSPEYKVQIVDFPSKNGKKMRGWLYLPKGNIHDVVIIGGNVGNVKEQGPHEYGRQLASKNISALVFDFVNFGESEGGVRNLEDPGQKIDDFRGAVNFVANRPEFAGTRITLAGLGASAGYIASEAVSDPRIDRLVMISPWIPNIDYFKSPEFDAASKLQASRQANHQYQQDGVLTYVPVASYSDKTAIIQSEDPADIDYYTNPDRGNIPQWQNRFATMGWSHFINYDAISPAGRLRVPTIIIRSASGPYAEGVADFISQMRVKPVDHVLSVAPYEFYDRPATIDQTVRIIEDFLNPASTDTEVTTL